MASEAMDTLEEVTGMLMQKGGATANLRIALHMRSVKKVKAFIEQGVNINLSDGHGYTPLHYAVQNNQKEIVQLLLANGADINTKDNLRRTPLDIAMEKEGDQDIVKLLVGNVAEVSTHVAAFIGDADKIKDFIEHDGSLDTRDVRDWTLLHWATAGNHKDIAKLLIEKGADVNAKDNWDWTPLHCAIYSSKDITEIKSMIELLIATGADTNAKDGGGSTPLRYAQKEGYTEIVQLLCKHGAK
jgi:ankyrin repeat protein